MKISDRLERAPPESQTVRVLGMLASTNKGQFVADADARLTQLVARLQTIAKHEDRDAKGELTIKIKLETLRGQIAHTLSVDAKLPGDRPVKGLLYGDTSGNLFFSDPEAPGFAFAVTGSFDPDTGEVRD
jgi:hypothetical protein